MMTSSISFIRQQSPERGRDLLDVPIAPTDLKLPFYSAWPQAQRMMKKRDV
jgi:hypothetical protein